MQYCILKAVAAEIDPNLGADGVPMALADVQCLPNVNGLYPVLDGTFDRFVACRNGKTVGRIRKCAADNLFSFGWQSCIAEKFMVAFDERALVSATTRSAGGEVSPASFQCAEYGNPEDPSIYYKNCSGVILNAQCDKGQTWSAGAGCVDTLGSTDGNAYEGYTRLANWDYKTNRMPCSLVNKVVKAFEAKGATKFVMKLRGRGVSAEFAFEVISSKRGINRPNGFGRSASVRIMAETNIKSLQIGGKTL
ncbi:hypothetical protein COO60DRAFT_1641258 [Scenedesmus sp. NREL 46B-D3]|nr:hypothetical protein COO60DRAFT_1641258 [Scenedesmus sp. NREL 46B-D3]